MVKYSFRHIRIANNLNGDENYLFYGYQKLKDEVIIEKDVN